MSHTASVVGKSRNVTTYENGSCTVETYRNSPLGDGSASPYIAGGPRFVTVPSSDTSASWLVAKCLNSAASCEFWSRSW